MSTLHKDHRDILIAPVVSEKSYGLLDERRADTARRLQSVLHDETVGTPQALTERDAAAREQIFVQAEMKLAEDMPVIPVYWRHEDYAASEKLVEGYARKPFQAYNFIYTKLAD